MNLTFTFEQYKEKKAVAGGRAGYWNKNGQGKKEEWLAGRGKWQRGQGFSHSGEWSKALKGLCFNRIVRQDTASFTGSCRLEHNDWSVWYFICSIGN